MNLAALRPRERRLLLVAALLTLGVLAYSYGIEPLAARHREVQELIEARRQLLARQMRLLARQDHYAQEKQALEAEIAQRRARLLTSDKPPVAASELQKLVKTTADGTGVEVRSERVLPTAERGGYTEVPVEVTLSGPIRALVALLYRLEGAPVLVTVNDVKLRVVSIGAPRELSATLSLSGYIPSPPASETRPGSAPPGRGPGA
jgi:type II secretory pathway component PulM